MGDLHGEGLKIPFSVNMDEILFLTVLPTDTRLSGWGLWFSGILLISLAVIAYYLIRNRRNKTPQYWICLAMVVLVLVPPFFIPGLFWARYYPQLFLLPIVALIILFIKANTKRRKILPLLLIIPLLINVSSSVGIMGIQFINSYYTRIALNNFAQENAYRHADIRFANGEIFNGVIINMHDKGIINYTYNADFYEYDGSLFTGVGRVVFKFE